MKAGLRSGDRIVSINGKTVSKWPDIAKSIEMSDGREIVLRFYRNDQIEEVHLKPQVASTMNVFGEEIESYKIGIISSSNTIIEKQGPLKAFFSGMVQTWVMTKLTVLSIIKLIEGTLSPSTLGGPILIAQIAGTQVEKGLMPFAFFMAILSVNLGVLNLIPIPVLDGGHLLFFVMELIIGKEINIKWREWAQQIGFAFLILLMLFVFYNDIMRIVGG
jgi:regulator of sigma E protease